MTAPIARPTRSSRMGSRTAEELMNRWCPRGVTSIRCPEAPRTGPTKPRRLPVRRPGLPARSAPASSGTFLPGMYQPTGRTWGNSPASRSSPPAQAGRRLRALPFLDPRMMGMCAGGAMLVGREPLAQHPADQPENDRGRAGPCRCDHRRRGSPPAANCSGRRGRFQRRRAHPAYPPRAASFS